MARAAGSAPVALKRTSGPRLDGPAAKELRTAARLRLRIPKAGPFTVGLPLPRLLAPGRYALSASPDVTVAAAAGTVTVSRPAGGIVTRAFVSRRSGGDRVLRITGRSSRRIVANFRFALTARSPARLRVHWFWKGPGGKKVLSPRRARSVGGLVVSPPLENGGGGALPAGRYRAVLVYGFATVATTSVVVG
jgi:hypothetical protein